jgi:hypothetical protein
MNNTLLAGSLILLVVIIVLFLNRVRETFQVDSKVNIQPDLNMKQYITSLGNNTNNSSENGTDTVTPPNYLNTNEYVKRTNIELVAREAARAYCPVPSDYDVSQYIKKTLIPEVATCPKMPNLKNFVLKSSIPPVVKCQSCVCPRVKVSAGLCKKCPPANEICPKPQACGVSQCKHIIKCPEPKPCPTSQPCVCPPVQINNKPLKCPPPMACPTPPPCPKVERCNTQKCPKCKYYGIKTLPTKSVEEQLKELINGTDTNKEAKLGRIRQLLSIKCNNVSNSQGSVQIPVPTSTADLKNNNAYVVVAGNPVIDYNNKCEDESLIYGSMGVLGSRF